MMMILNNTNYSPSRKDDGRGVGEPLNETEYVTSYVASGRCMTRWFNHHIILYTYTLW